MVMSRDPFARATGALALFLAVQALGVAEGWEGEPARMTLVSRRVLAAPSLRLRGGQWQRAKSEMEGAGKNESRVKEAVVQLTTRLFSPRTASKEDFYQAESMRALLCEEVSDAADLGCEPRGDGEGDQDGVL
eukprot:428926-Hanusia_phi.AAC.1